MKTKIIGAIILTLFVGILAASSYASEKDKLSYICSQSLLKTNMSSGEMDMSSMPGPAYIVDWIDPAPPLPPYPPPPPD